ncbi:hypothetical protein, conserved [Leishmania tarentolae]|uniref:Uncharacterized protein n=1 Tax=Leishmania tarentolae TaxID=5689 RepID=A0A640K9W0_LEITA|nr:hypothetical protein, conserved [Leishmania tarentolae]
MPDTYAAVNPKALSRLDALPGSLGKVSLCAAVMLGITTYVNLRTWLARRAATSSSDEDKAAMVKWGQRKSASKEATSGGKVKGAGTSFAGGNGGADGEATVTGRSGSAGGVAATGAQTPPERPQLPPRNYFTVRASMHVKRHSAKLMEWYDAQLGIQVPFSPVFFELRQEERQAPLILLSFRAVREPTHRMAVTIEELNEPQTAAAYREASLSRIADCAKILGQSTARIGSRDHPAAEYCYIDDHQLMNCVFSIFVVDERLAVTVQYVAPSRVRSVMPTAVYDTVRFLSFSTPSPSPSYLLVSEPRLGLGYHLPLDFLVHEGLAESDGVEDRLFTSAMTTGGGRPLSAVRGGGIDASQLYTRGTAGAEGAAHPPYYHPSSSYAGHSGGGGDDSAWMVPYATAMSRGGRRMGLISSYEPADAATATSAFDDSGCGAAAAMGGSGATYEWQAYLQQQVCKAVRQLGLVLGSSDDNRAPHVVFQAPDAAHPPSRPTLVVEPYPLSITLKGNFSAADDVREEDSDSVALVTAFSLFREVGVDVNSAYLTLIPDALETAVAAAAARSHSSTGVTDLTAGTVKAYWSAFYVPVGTACVSFHFIASALRHSSTEFMSFCATVMNSVSLGNHYGQSVSVLYCNTRHDVLPFRLSLPPTGMAAVEEPILADPLCVVQATYGVEKVGVTVRVFPLFTCATSLAEDGSSGGGGSGLVAATTTTDGRPPTPFKALPTRLIAERRGTRQRSIFRQLQHMIRYYLSQFPGGVQILSQERTTMNAMPAIRVCFKPLWHAGDIGDYGAQATDGGSGSGVPPAPSVTCWDEAGGGGGGSSQVTSDWAGVRDALLEEEIGQLNPFAQYFPPPPPPASYLWGQQQQPQPVPPSSSTTGKVRTPVTAASLRKVSTAGSVARSGGEVSAMEDPERQPFHRPRGDESQRSQEELNDPLRVAIVVCCEGNAFLFQASASEYTLDMSVEGAQTLAMHLALIPRGN